MKKTIIGIALVLMTLGCTGQQDTGDGGETTSTILSLIIEDSSVTAGFSTTATAAITNNWATDIESGNLTMLPGRTDVIYTPSEQEIQNIIKDTSQTAYVTIDTQATTFPNTYEMYGRFCFNYTTEAQQNVVIYTGESQTLPTNSYTNGPMSVAFGGTPQLNAQTQNRMTILITISNIGNGVAYDNWDASSTANRLKKVAITVPDDYVDVGSINNFAKSDELSNDGVNKTFIWNSNIRMVSDKLQISVPMDKTDLTLAGEVQRAVRVTVEYGYCVDSNMVSLDVVRQ